MNDCIESDHAQYQANAPFQDQTEDLDKQDQEHMKIFNTVGLNIIKTEVDPERAAAFRAAIQAMLQKLTTSKIQKDHLQYSRPNRQ